MSLNKIDMVSIHWEHGGGPDEKEVAELNSWLCEKEARITVRFEGTPDHLELLVQREEW